MRFFFKLLFVVLHFSTFSQNWSSLGGGTSGFVRGLYADTINNKIYAVGNFEFAGQTPVYQVGVWDGNAWQSVGGGTRDTGCFYGGCNPIFTLIKYQNDLYVGGSHFIMGGSAFGANKFLSKYDGVNWQSAGNPNTLAIPMVMNDSLFVVGGFDTIGGNYIQRVSKWNGSSWISFGSPLPWYIDSGGAVIHIGAFYQNEYYFAGNFENIGTNFNEIIRWNGLQWDSLGSGILGDAYVNDMVVYNGLLYVAGWFSQNDGNVSSCIMAWNGTQWINPLPSDVGYYNGITDLNVIDNKLYISGRVVIGADSSMFSLAHFDGTQFCTFGGRANFPNISEVPPGSMVGINHEFYIACTKYFWGDTVNYVAKWNGGNTTDTCISIVNASLQNIQNSIGSFNLFPNPTNSVLYIEFENAITENYTISIANVLGQTVYSKQTSGSKIQISVDEFSNGIYIVQVQSKKGMLSKKFVKG